MSIIGKLKPKKFNVILFLIGFVLSEIILNSMVTCLDSCPTDFYFEPVVLFPSIIVGLVFYIIGSFLEKIFYKIIKVLGE